MTTNGSDKPTSEVLPPEPQMLMREREGAPLFLQPATATTHRLETLTQNLELLLRRVIKLETRAKAAEESIHEIELFLTDNPAEKARRAHAFRKANEWIGMKEMCKKLGAKDDPDVRDQLRIYCKMHMREHGLEARTNGPGKQRVFGFYPRASGDFACEKVKGMLDRGELVLRGRK